MTNSIFQESATFPDVNLSLKYLKYKQILSMENSFHSLALDTWSLSEAFSFVIRIS